jgi:polysaccharide biosynthesis transport protein
VNRSKEALGNSNQLLVQRNILQRDFDANQQLYQNLMQRLKDATVSAGLRSTNIHQVDTALSPDKPVRPKKVLNISIGLVVGLMLGLMLAFVQEAMDDSVGGAEEIENMLAVPSLGFIPLQRLGSRNSQSLTVRTKDAKQLEGGAPSVMQKPNSVFAEAFRSLRTAILLSTPTRPPQTLLITSAQPGEGKSTSAINLAIVLAQRKGPVLLIDADMRRGGISSTLNLPRAKGLSTVLSGADTMDEAMQPHELLPELLIMGSGPVPPSPADLLSSDKMAEILLTASKRFEHIVIDTPPVLSVTDATILSRMVDGVVLVVQSGTTARGGLLRTVRTLHAAGARILGVLLNKLDGRNRGYAYYKRYYGGSYYGDSAPYGEETR